MKTYEWCDGFGMVDLSLTLEEAEACSHPGDCEADVLALMQQPHMRRQLDEVNPAALHRMLREYGAWDDQELADHERNLTRLVWLACCDVAERPEDYA